MYVYRPDAEPRRMFKPQRKNPNDIHLFFSPDQHKRVEYVVEVLRTADKMAGGGSQKQS